MGKMTTNITLDGGKELKLAANAATPFRFKQIFGADLLKLFQQNTETAAENVMLADVVSQLAFIMNMQAEGKNLNAVSMDDFYAWLEGFEPMELPLAGQAIINTYMSSAATSVSPKKK